MANEAIHLGREGKLGLGDVLVVDDGNFLEVHTMCKNREK